ncbi:hypothetical protein DKX38_027571 [Salix brachista]|uniref:RING-type E3 ubiquitin transferase n=1 Tax=Salix brachista TaxID=2182728 RepID=A0A5N5J895_9ROSI|nr:hypothetical protein DKX38_027571 [Salix brachista]
MWMPRSLPEKRVGGNGLVAVAIDRDKSSQIALKWAIDNLLVKGQTVILIHVNLKSSLSSHSSSPRMNQCVDSKDVFLPFRCFCTRKDISCKHVMLEDTDVAKALTEYVTQTLIETLIVGGSTKGGFLRMLKCDDRHVKMANKLCINNPNECFCVSVESDLAGSVSKGAPDFCTVYVISKGKIQSMRPASRHAPSTPLHNQLLSQNGTMPAASMAMHIPPTPAKRGWGFVFVFVFCSSFVLIGGLCKEKKTRIAEKKLCEEFDM